MDDREQAKQLIERVGAAYASARFDPKSSFAPNVKPSVRFALGKLLRTAHQVRSGTAAALRWLADRPDLLEPARLRRFADVVDGSAEHVSQGRED